MSQLIPHRIELHGPLEPPEEWQKSGVRTEESILVDSVIEKDDETYELKRKLINSSWHIPKIAVCNIQKNIQSD